MSLEKTFAEYGAEIERTIQHIESDDKETIIALLIGWMGINRAKEMNDFWDESKEERYAEEETE